MGKLIKIHDIDEFSAIQSIPDAAINDTILLNIRKLDEENELEKSVREILYDPNKTPHGPTEIADILTTHLNIRGTKKLSAFVLKGRSYKKVSSKEVAHQIIRLRQIPDLGLMVFGAVGNIQDDAQRDFVQCAMDSGCDYLIIDAQDWARLLIAYEKSCPKDGTTYDETGTCKNGHSLDSSLTLEMEIREKYRYTITSQKDVSHNGAKRYSAIVITDRHYTRDILKTIIHEATDKLKISNYYRNEHVKARWGKTDSHVVWLYIAYDTDDIKNVNWVCRTCWIDTTLPEAMKPNGLNGNEKYNDIEILWNDSYKSNKDFLERNTGTKEEFIEYIVPILKDIIKLANEGIKLFEKYSAKNISENDLIKNLQTIEPNVSKLYKLSGNTPIAPDDCKDYDQACQNLFATAHDLFLYYSEKGLKIWPKSNREWLMQNTIKRLFDDIKRIEFEENKIH